MNEQHRKAMKLALEALNTPRPSDSYPPLWRAYEKTINEAITAIKEALSSPNGEAQPKQRSVSEHLEPVAFLVYDHGASSQYLAFDDELGDMDGCEVTNLYTTPYVATPRPQRKPLTDEEIAKQVEAELTHYWNGEYIDTTGARDQLTAFARAIESAHGIKE